MTQRIIYRSPVSDRAACLSPMDSTRTFGTAYDLLEYTGNIKDKQAFKVARCAVDLSLMLEWLGIQKVTLLADGLLLGEGKSEQD